MSRSVVDSFLNEGRERLIKYTSIRVHTFRFLNKGSYFILEVLSDNIWFCIILG